MKKKIILIGVLFLVIGLGAGRYFVSEERSPYYTKQYTEEEWQALSESDRQTVVRKRMCDPNSKLRATHIDCSKYE